MGIPAIVTAGDLRASRAIYGESKVYLEVAGREMVVRVVEVLQRVPEIDSVWVVGNASRLGPLFEREDVRRNLIKPLHMVEQFRNLYENCWQSFRRALPDAGPDGRDPRPDEEHAQALFLSGDLPFATAQEIQDFIAKGQQSGCDYALGLVSQETLAPFLPEAPGQPGIEVAYFNVREGRLRQNNLHLAKPARMGARHYIEEMYEHRHQRELRDQLGLAFRLLREQGSLSILLFYSFMHLAGVADRRGWRGLADWLRNLVSMERVQRVCGQILKTDFRFLVTEVGGCAIDIDTEQEYDTANARFDEWRAQQEALAETLHGTLPLPAAAAENARASQENA